MMLVYTPRIGKLNKKGTNGRRKVRRQQLLRLDPSCCYCGAPLTEETATIDHVIPLSKGGTWADGNTVLACKPCNNAKGDQVPADVPVAVKPVKKRKRWRGCGVLTP